MSVQVSYRKQAVVMLFLFLLFLVAIEGIVRIYEYANNVCPNIESEVFTDVDPFTRKQICNDHNNLEFIHPTIMLIKPDQHFPTININSHGFRGPEISVEKSDDVYRIFVVGGSSMFGSGATSDEKTIPGFLQKEFDNVLLPKKIEIINAGIGSATSFQETYLIKNYLIKFNPDLFIIYDGNNDSHFHYFADSTLNPVVNDLENSDNFFESLIVELIKSNKVKISSFGTFKVSNKKERIGRNPKTKVEVKIAARKVIKFKPSNTIKERLNR